MLPLTLSTSSSWAWAEAAPQARAIAKLREKARRVRDMGASVESMGGPQRMRRPGDRFNPLRYNSPLSLVMHPSGVPVPHPSARPKPIVLLILDGWGYREDPADNALAQADIPNWRRLWAGAPHTLIHTEGRHVGLPDGQMGNSEVGHMNLGAGRIVYQDLTRIDAAIE